MTKSKNLFISFLLTFALIAILISTASAAGVQSITRINVSATGEEANEDSYLPAISSDGRFVVFGSTASNLIPGDTNFDGDIFRKDLQTGNIVRVSESSLGEEGDGNSWNSDISSDGRYAVFDSGASNLIPNDSNGAFDIFRKDLQTGNIVRVSESSLGEESVSESETPVISADGRFAAFTSYASNLVPGDTNGRDDIFRKDLQTGEIIRVSANSSGGEANSSSRDPDISSDGRFVVFQSYASNLVSNDTNETFDIFRKDLITGDIVRVSLNSIGQEANGESWQLAVSADGRFVAFDSWANNLVSNDTNERSDVFRKDLQTGNITRISENSFNEQANGISGYPSMSADGRFVVFTSWSSNLDPADTDILGDIYRKDTLTGDLIRVSISVLGEDTTNGNGEASSISADGRFIVFESASSNLVLEDTNDTKDIFLADLGVAQPTPQTVINDINQYLQTGDIANEGTAASLISQIESAERAIANQNINAAIQQLEAFIKSVEAKSGKTISEEAANALIQATRTIIANLQNP